MALGYTLVYGVLGLINFAHSEVFMIGTFGALFTTRAMGISPGESGGTGVALVFVLLGCLLVAMAVSGFTAVALERIAYRPLRRRGAGRLAALISAIGASLFLSELFGWSTFAKAVNIQIRSFEAFPRLFEKSRVFSLFGGDVRTDKLLIVVAAVVMMFVLDHFVRHSRLGRGIRAVAQDSETAALMGVNIDRIVSATFLLGGIMAGAAALLFLIFYENTVYNVGFVLGIKAFTAAVLGGIGNLRGALLGGLTLGLFEKYGGSVFGAQWIDVIAFGILVLILMVRPTGLLGQALSKARA